MELLLRRTNMGRESTIGELTISGRHQCFTLEPLIKEAPAKPRAIPEGRYQIAIRPSTRFGVPMPHLEGVPDFEGILIHYGNSVKDTHGCILVGESVGPTPDWIVLSTVTFNALMRKLELALRMGENLFLTIQ